MQLKTSHSRKSLVRLVEVNENKMQGNELAIAINKALVAPSKMMPLPTPLDKLPIENPATPYFVSAVDVEPGLRTVKVCPDFAKLVSQQFFF